MQNPTLLLPLLLVAALPAQTTQATIPAVCTHLPGNAAIAMPLRWSQGMVQVQIDHELLPAGLVPGSTITSLRLRRPALLDEPAYGALTRTLTVRAAFTTQGARSLVQNLAANRVLVNDPLTGTGLTTVFGPAQVSVAATAANGPGQQLGAEFLTLSLTARLTVPPAGTFADPGLFLEIEASDPVFGADPGNWVDTIWFDGGAVTGYAAPVGNRGCDSAGRFSLLWAGSAPPRRGVNASLRVEQAVPGALLVTFLGFDPATRASVPTLGTGFYMGFGAPLAALGMTGCFQWSPIDSYSIATASTTGAYAYSFALPPAVTTVGMQLGAQVAELAPTANPMGILVSNGQVLVLDDAGVGNHCSTVIYLGAVTATSVAPWPPYYGMMPVLGIDF